MPNDSLQTLVEWLHGTESPGRRIVIEPAGHFGSDDEWVPNTSALAFNLYRRTLGNRLAVVKVTVHRDVLFDTDGVLDQHLIRELEHGIAILLHAEPERN